MLDIQSVEIPESAWDEDSGRFITTLSICGLLMHVEAYPVLSVDEDDIQRFGDWEDEILSAYAAFHAEGGLETTTILGRECVIFASPFCS